MNISRQFPTLVLVAGMVLALGLSAGAFAEYRGDDQAERHAGAEYMSEKPAGAMHSRDLIGKKITHRATGEDVGEIRDLVISDDGRLVGVVVETGGFLGLGGQDVGLGWEHVEHTMEDGQSMFFVDIDEETLRNAPRYERD